MDNVLNKFRFRNFPIYIHARKLRKEIRLLTQKFPPQELSCLTRQLWRAFDSIILNIAEGSDRGSDKDFAHYLNNAHTSLNEVVGCMDLAFDSNYISLEEQKII